jgi:hypothetical protein
MPPRRTDSGRSLPDRSLPVHDEREHCQKDAHACKNVLEHISRVAMLHGQVWDADFKSTERMKYGLIVH